MNSINYRIQARYKHSKLGKVMASLTVLLPTVSKTDCQLHLSYRDESFRLLGLCLTAEWGESQGDGYRKVTVYNFQEGSIKDLKKLLEEEVKAIECSLHRIFIKDPPQTPKLAKLPKDFVLEIDPSIPKFLPGTQELSALDRWRQNLKIQDAIACWVEDREMLVTGWIQTITRFKTYPERIELQLIEECHCRELLTLSVTDEDILPPYCDRRSDEWRFGFKEGDLVGWKSPFDPEIRRVDRVRTVEHDLENGLVSIIWDSDGVLADLSYMDLFQP